MEERKIKDKKSKGLYLLPNLFTTASLFAAFYAIIASIDGRFEYACMAIVISIFLDMLDGRVARMTGSQSDFGAQYDSLCDNVAFGIAPAVLAYTWALSSLGKIGWLAAFIYISAVTLRLARFNTQINDEVKKYFQGLPCPPAGGLIASFIWVFIAYEIPGEQLSLFILALLLFLTLLMVSRARYHSFKQVDLGSRMPAIVGMLVVLVFVAVSIDPPKFFLLLSLGYVLSGVIITAWQLRRRGKKIKVE